MSVVRVLPALPRGPAPDPAGLWKLPKHFRGREALPGGGGPAPDFLQEPEYFHTEDVEILRAEPEAGSGYVV